MDYQSNSKKSKSPEKTKEVEKVVTGEVVSKPKPIGRKFKDIFITADFGSVVTYVGQEVLIPAARNMIVDTFTKGIERMMYGDTRPRHRRSYSSYDRGPRVTYNSPVSRSAYREPSTRPPAGIERRRDSRDIILSSRDEAELVIERLNDICDSYDVASVADLHDLVGLPTTHVDNKWGWSDVTSASVHQVREGYLLDLPPAEAI